MKPSADLMILGLDVSSTHIGLVLLAGDTRLDRLTWRLMGGDVAARCLLARDLVTAYLDQQADVDLVAIEAPVLRRFKRGNKAIDTAHACIQQSRVQGTVLSVIAESGILWTEITPAQAKHALTGKGNASKAEVFQAATQYFQPEDTHQADAFALCLAAQRLHIEKTAA